MRLRSPIVASATTPITTAELVATTKLDAAARSLATRALPAAQHIGFTTIELTVIETVAGRISSRHDTNDAEAQSLRGALAEIPDTATDDGASTLETTVTQAVMATLQTQSGPIREIVGAERQAEAEFQAYRHKHQLLERSPIYPESQTWHLAIVMALALVEALASTGMYVAASSSGVLGAWVTAMAVTTVSIAGAGAAGYLPARYMMTAVDLDDAPNRRRNTLAWTIPSLILATVTIGFVNLAAAHYRELAAATDGSFQDIDVLLRLWQQPLSLSVASLGLMCAGLLCAVVASVKAYTASDPYPGYEHQHRRYTSKVEARDDLTASLHGQLDAIRMQHVDGVLNRGTATKAALLELRRRHNALLIAVAHTERLNAADVTAATNALLRFRSINLEVRSDGVVPKAFLETLDLQHLIPTASIEDLTDSVATAVDAHRATAESLLAAATAQMERINRAQDRLPLILKVIQRHSGGESDGRDLSHLDELRRLIDDDRHDPEMPVTTGLSMLTQILGQWPAQTSPVVSGDTLNTSYATQG
jgi:hypothetical protein